MVRLALTARVANEKRNYCDVREGITHTAGSPSGELTGAETSFLAGLSPGVTASVYNAGELGTVGTALSQLGKSNDGIYVHGMRPYRLQASAGSNPPSLKATATFIISGISGVVQQQ
jgi:hypothetical protein